jgi:hypothetical protein
LWVAGGEAERLLSSPLCSVGVGEAWSLDGPEGWYLLKTSKSEEHRELLTHPFPSKGSECCHVPLAWGAVGLASMGFSTTLQRSPSGPGQLSPSHTMWIPRRTGKIREAPGASMASRPLPLPWGLQDHHPPCHGADHIVEPLS